MDCFINEDGRNETSKYFFSEACEVADQKTTLHSYHSKQDKHDPETNPTAPWEKFHMIYTAKLKYNNKQSELFNWAQITVRLKPVVSLRARHLRHSDWLWGRFCFPGLTNWEKVILTDKVQFEKVLPEQTTCLKLKFQHVWTVVWISKQSTVGKNMVIGAFTHTS